MRLRLEKAMDARHLSVAALAALAVTAAVHLALPARAQQEAVLQLKWADLMPPAPAKPPKAFFAGRAPADPQAPTLPETIPEGRWMSGGKQQASVPVPVVESLNGKRVQIGGYVVPLDFEATSVKEFLLVPFVGACIHVPPPPANQLVFVQAAKGFPVKGLFEPVWVTGRMKTEMSFTGIADAGYTLQAESVSPRKE
jgi:hypothetical protein